MRGGAAAACRSGASPSPGDVLMERKRTETKERGREQATGRRKLEGAPILDMERTPRESPILERLAVSKNCNRDVPPNVPSSYAPWVRGGPAPDRLAMPKNHDSGALRPAPFLDSCCVPRESPFLDSLAVSKNCNRDVPPNVPSSRPASKIGAYHAPEASA